MSGGPLIEACGNVVGINTMGDNGMSLFISMSSVLSLRPEFSDEGVSKIELTDAKTPVDAVVIFYTYLKGRLWKPGFEMLSQKYLEKTNYEEWTNRFQNILSVDIVSAEAVDDQPNTVFVKFQTATWADEEIVVNSYEGTWETLLEGDVYKMNKSKIKEVINPDYKWFYNIEEESDQQSLF
jgi:hypothetical protein